MKLSKFRPTPAEILDAYSIEIDREPQSDAAQSWSGNHRPKYLDEPTLSLEERAAIVAETPRPDFTQPTRINYEAMKEAGIGMPHKKT